MLFNGYTLNIDDDTTFTNNMVYMYYTGTLNISEIKTFTDLQKAINMVEGDIHLSSNVTMLDSEADKFVNGIVVDHLVNLKCDGFTINANNLGRIFNVTSTADKLNIYNANLINGNADIGGAIYNTGSVYAYNTAFKDNTAATMGGAVFNKGTLTIQKCIVDSNDITKRTSSASEDYGGAAIYNWYDSTLFIKNSTISNNLKNYKNGDYIVGAVTSLGKTTISQNSYFVNNSGRWGGAITTSGSSLPGKKVNELSISESTFSKNGGLYGAGIFIEGSKFTITSCVFDSNTASGKGNMTPNDNNGAAIEVTNTDKAITGTISKTKFTNNKAQYGGAIDICAGTIKILNSKFINNSADVEGGAIDINAANGNPKVTISSSNFINNSAPVGGAICNVHDLTVKGSTFIDNTPNTIFNWVGAGGNLNLNIKTFTDLQNAIGLVTGTLTLNQNVAMTAKEAANFVNGVVINKNIAIDGKGHTIDAKNLGRIFSIGEGFTVTLTNATLINGKADKGGAIYNDGSLTLSDVKLSDNAADSYGGAVFNNGHLVVSDSVFDSNDIVNRGSASVDYGGAAIYNWYDGVLTVSGSNFINNIKNYKNGDRLVGAIATIGDATISDSYFVNNAGRWGGAISTAGYLLAGDDVNTLTVSGSTFKENGGLYGAGIFVAGSDFTVSDCVFDKNSAFGKGDMTPNNNNGAAIVVTDTGKDITGIITDSNFTNNKAHFSGAVDICEGKITIKNSIFVNNSADVEGGAIDINTVNGNPEVSISGSKFINNSASYGGAIVNVKDLTVRNTEFVNNAPDTIFNYVGFGGNLDLGIENFTDLQNAIGLVTGTLTLNQNVVMTDDEAANFVNGVVINKNIRIDGKGHTIDARDLGRIFSIGEGFTVTLTNATLINGKADKGGAIYNDGSLTLSDVKLSDNAADSYGGAVFNNGNLVVSDSVFDSNDIVNRGSASVDYGGAAIYNWKEGTLKVTNSNFTNNIKNYKNGDNLVGAITTIGNATVSGSNFVNNSGRWGGALAATGGVSGSAINTISVDGTKFVNNTALYGGAMFVWASNYTISNSVFDNNSAFGKGDMSPNDNNGGALIVTQDNIPVSGKIVNSNFTNNKAQYGGAAWINEGTVDIDGSNFINNTATTTAGAIGFDSQYTKIIATVDSSKFVNNTAGSYAGAIYNLGDLTVSGSEFDNNKAQFGDIIYNNKIYNKEGILSINGNKYSNYTENKAPIINIGDINTISSTGGIIVTVLDNKTVNVCYGDVVTLHATVVADGVLVAGQKLFFVIDNVEYIANSLGNGSYIASYEVKDVGSKTVGIVYDGPEVHINTGILNVSKATPDLTVGALNITVGDLEIITVTGPKDATGLITLTLNGIDYTLPIYNGEAKFYFQDLTADEYEVSASYSGDNHYVAAENSTVFKVDKVLANLKINVEDITFGENGLVIITLPSDIDGSVVTVNVNGKVYSVTVENGFAKLPLRELNAGDYTISAVFAGNDKYLPGVSNALLTVSKADPALNVFISDVDYGGIFNINVALTGVDAIGLNGNVIVTVNNKDYTVAVTDGKGNVTGVKLAAGSYDFTAKFAGDNNYNAVSDSGNFKVNKVDSAIDVAVSDIKVGEDAVITVKLLRDATGNVTVNVNGKNYNGTVIHGMANVKVSGLKADTYDVAVKYSGDNNYNDAVATSSFTVSKVDPTMDVTVDDIVFGEDLTVEAVLPADATGKVVIVVDGTPYTANITDGKATQVVKDLTAGYHTVSVKYDGDDKYNDVVVDGFVIVDKAQPVLGVVIADVNYGNEFAIEATLTGVNSTPLTGNVIVTVNGKFYVVNVTDGKGTLTGVKLAAGTYGFTAVWAGNDNYAAVDENGDFKVNKLNSTVAVNADDIKVGENVTVSVNVPSDATGNVIVTVDGKDYTVAIVDGKAVKTIADLKANNYTVTVKYAGDNNYNPNQNTTKFTVSKISDYNMNITVPGDVKVGEDAVIIVNVPKDASGNVTVSVGKDVYNAVISNGSAKVVVSGLGAGVYNVSATFTDDKYAQNKANATVVVSKITDYNMNVTVPEFKEGVNSTISVDLPKDATGTVTVEIDGKKYTANVTNGTAKVNIPALSAGNHNITTTYSGDAKYDSMTKKGNITVIPNVNLDVNDVVMFYHDGTRLVAKLTDSQGKPIVNATIYFNINGVDYAKSTDDNGTASMGLNLDSNVYAVTVTYNGSDIYSKISKNVTVTINPSIIAKDLVKMYQNDTKFYAKFIGSDGKALVNTTVRFNIHGVFYNRTTNDDGIAELGIMLRPGNYILTAYNPVTGEEQGFNITVKSLIVQNDLTKYYLNASRFQATIYDKNGSLAVNKTVTFNIHGVFYTRSTDDKGVVSLGISLRPGEYIITTIYEGLAVGNNITVLPTLVTSDLNMTHEDGSNFTAQTLDGQGKPLANQNVTFNINGVFYNKVTDENGVASLAMRLMSGKYIITSYWNDFQTGNTIIIS